MAIKVLAPVAFGVFLAACTPTEKPLAGPSMPVATAFAQCGKDTDCKGERICDKGACVAPQRAPQSSNQQSSDSSLIGNTGQSYSGAPATDVAFSRFITNNAGKTVHLDIKVGSADDITDGYRGVQPVFEGAALEGISYSYFLECDGIAPDAETTIGKCGDLVSWDPTKLELAGWFKVDRVIQTGMPNSRAAFLIPVSAPEETSR